MKTYFLLLSLVSLALCYNDRSQRGLSALRQVQDLLDSNEEEVDSARRSNHRLAEDSDDDDDQYMELRSVKINTGSTITLQNRAAMNTRLRVLYSDAACNPFLLETGRLFVGQSKSVTVPADAKNIKIIVEKDLIFETWRVAYTGTLSNGNQCIRIVGVTFSSKIHPCK